MNKTSIDQIRSAQSEWQNALGDDHALQRMANESLKMCADAVQVLCENLREWGYEYAHTQQLPESKIEQNVSLLEGAIQQPVPLILVSFWKIVGGISFVDLENYRHVGFWKEQQLVSPNGYCDGLYVDICSQEWTDSICSDFNDWREDQAFRGTDPFLLALSPDGYHKDGISGGAPYGVFPGSTWKPIWQYFSWSGMQYPRTAGTGPTDFLSFLRTAILECAGFPALLGLPGFEQIRIRLLDNVPLF